MSGRRFQARFGIPRILEFYAATEGIVSLYNAEGKPGAIGRIPSFLAHRFPVALVRSDPETAEPVRNADGLCIACGADEPGEAIGQLPAAEAMAARHSTVTPTRRPRRGRCCATSSPRATRGSAPAT